MKTLALYVVRAGGKDGYINAQGKVVIKPQFEIAHDFHENRAVVAEIDPKKQRDPLTNMFRQKVGFINTACELVVPLQCDDMHEEFSEGLIGFRVGKRWGFMNPMGEVVIEPQFDQAYRFSEGLATVRIKRAHAAINRKGDIVFKRSGASIGECVEGLMASEAHHRWSYLDPKGETAFNVTCTAAGEFSEGLASVLIRGRLGYIDKTGRIAIPPQFAQAGNFHEGLAAVEVIEGTPQKRDWSKPQQFGYVDTSGALAIPAKFTFAGDFAEGMAPISLKAFSKQGYIDKKGDVVIEPISCELALPFSGPLARIQGSGEKVGYINRKGDFVWPMQK